MPPRFSKCPVAAFESSAKTWPKRTIPSLTPASFPMKMPLVCLTLALSAGVSLSAQPAAPATSFPVAITVEANRPLGELRPIWRFFGADEPNYAYMKDGRKLLGELGELAPQHVYFRAHNLFSTGDGTPAFKWGSTNAYTEDAAGNPVYDWTIIDRIFDAYLANGVKPLVELGFMPQALSIKPDPYQHKWTPTAKYSEIFTGWAYPPKDYEKWGELCYQLAKHCVERYGRAEVETWWWQPWNEYNSNYWKGSFDDYHKLYDYSAAGVRRALPNARFGGPSAAAGIMAGALKKFLHHSQTGTNYVTGQTGTPLDMISFHAKGQPKIVEGHIRMNLAKHLKEIDDAFALIATFPQLKQTPVILTESDPEGCAACQGPSFGYRNGTMYSSYTAASFARKQDLAAKHSINLEGVLTWAFEFEEQGHFAGFRVLASNGIDHPVLNVFRMFSRMSGQRLAVASDGAYTADVIIKTGVVNRPDVSALASRDGNRLAVMVWHYHDDDIAGPDATVTLTIPGLPADLRSAQLTHYRIDQTHSNAYAVWQQMGSPAKPDAAQYAQLEKAGQLAALTDAPATVTVQNATATLPITLPRQAVSLIVLEW